MKRILSFASVALLASAVSAQTIVSTTPANRNVLLEDLTGIFCGFCPDGALRADQFKDQNPGRVVIIGNHAGIYANASNPGAKQFDFRTPEGTYVDAFSDPSGYPAGNINRKVTSNAMKPGKTAMSRGFWTTEGTIILGESSPVNLAIQASYDAANNKIDILVEGYYTSNGNGTDYLTVAILQDNIVSYQSGASAYPDRLVNIGGVFYYKQMDVLRGYVTDYTTNGDAISSTSKDDFFSKTYSWTLPTPGPNAPAIVIEDLKIAAWMLEDMGWSEVITATEAYPSPVGIQEEASSVQSLRIYPNPTRDFAVLEFDLENSQQVAIDLYDATGKKVENLRNEVLNAGNHRIDVDGTRLPAGLYYVNIIAQDGIVSKKLMLNK